MTGRVRGHERATAVPGPWSPAVLDAVAEGIVALDDRGRITHVNAGAVRLLGAAAERLVGSDVHLALEPARLDGQAYTRRESPALACLQREATLTTNRALLRRGEDSTLAVEWSCAPVRVGLRVVGGVMSFRPLAAFEGHQHEEVTRLTERERAQREFLHQLQEAVRPRQPVVDGVELGVHYLPADPSAPSGGDLYDWQVLPDGDLHLAVVDVIGSGVSATKDALAVVHAVRVLVLEGCPVGQVVARADALLSESQPALVATLLIARYTPGTGRMVVAGGGHPPMLVVSPDGTVREVTAPGIPIGWPEAGSFEVVEVQLGRSDTALFYTDGLVEAGKDILAGLSQLKAAAAETAKYPPRHLPRVLVERALAGAQRRDDTLALVLRRRAVPSGPRPRLLGGFDHRFSPSLAAVPIARHLFGDWLGHQSIDPSDRDDLLVVVSELCTNAVRSAASPNSGLHLRAWPEGDALVMEVLDDGPGFELKAPPDDEVPGAEQVSGRGLFIVRSLVDELVAERTPAGMRVRAVKRHLFPMFDILETAEVLASSAATRS